MDRCLQLMNTSLAMQGDVSLVIDDALPALLLRPLQKGEVVRAALKEESLSSHISRVLIRSGTTPGRDYRSIPLPSLLLDVLVQNGAVLVAKRENKLGRSPWRGRLTSHQQKTA